MLKAIEISDNKIEKFIELYMNKKFNHGFFYGFFYGFFIKFLCKNSKNLRKLKESKNQPLILKVPFITNLENIFLTEAISSLNKHPYLKKQEASSIKQISLLSPTICNKYNVSFYDYFTYQFIPDILIFNDLYDFLTFSFRLVTRFFRF